MTRKAAVNARVLLTAKRTPAPLSHTLVLMPAAQSAATLASHVDGSAWWPPARPPPIIYSMIYSRNASTLAHAHAHALAAFSPLGLSTYR